MPSNFRQPAVLCSKLDTNLFLCDSQLGEVLIIMKLQGTCELLSWLGNIYRILVSTKRHCSLLPLPTVECENNHKSVADYFTSSVGKVKELPGQNTMNGPDGTISLNTFLSVRMLADGILKLNSNLKLSNEAFQIDL